MILASLDRLISLEPFWPGRVDPVGLMFRLGLATEEDSIFPNIPGFMWIDPIVDAFAVSFRSSSTYISFTVFDSIFPATTTS
jgi:hypothetical protein